MAQSDCTTEEVVERGEALYQERIRPEVEKPENKAKILLLDIETGDFVIDDDHWRAYRRTRDKRPNGVLYSLRIGYPTLGSVGGGWGAVQP